jgi:hypothetical protein
MPQAAPIAAEMLKFVAGQFRAGRELQGKIEEFADDMMVTRANGLIEVGNERPKPRKRVPVSDKAISDAIDKVVAEYSNGRRPAA